MTANAAPRARRPCRHPRTTPHCSKAAMQGVDSWAGLAGCRSDDWQGDADSRCQDSSSSQTKATVLTESSRRNNNLGSRATGATTTTAGPTLLVDCPGWRYGHYSGSPVHLTDTLIYWSREQASTLPVDYPLRWDLDRALLENPSTLL